MGVVEVSCMYGVGITRFTAIALLRIYFGNTLVMMDTCWSRLSHSHKCAEVELVMMTMRFFRLRFGFTKTPREQRQTRARDSLDDTATTDDGPHSVCVCLRSTGLCCAASDDSREV